MSYNPNTGLVYIPSIEMPGLFSDNHIDIQAWESPYWQFDPAVAFGDEKVPADAGTGALRAWDPLRQKLIWEVPLPGVWNPVTMTTAGNLLFQGRADGTVHEYDATSGKTLWQTDLCSGISAAPITYAVDGTQYVSILVSGGGAGSATAPGYMYRSEQGAPARFGGLWRPGSSHWWAIRNTGAARVYPRVPPLSWSRP